MSAVSHIDDATIDGMTEDELVELQGHLEELRRDEIKSRFASFSKNMEVPGVPIKGDDSTSFRRQLAKMNGVVYVDDADGKPQPHYAEKLDPAEHHVLIMDTAQAVIEREMLTPDGEPYDGMMVFLPPGSAKSTYLSMLMPAYFLGKFKNLNVISCSYGQDLANRFSRRARAIVESPSFADIMGVTLLEGSTGVQNWNMSNGSEYRAAGVTAGITGFRADILLIDDPVKGREDADSDVMRDKVWEAFEDDLSTRLKPNGSCIIVQTRWHEDDLSGRLLGPEWRGQSGCWKCTDGKNYYVINLPMICEHPDDLLGREIGPKITPKTMLWPNHFNAREQTLRQAKGDRTWTALYQQRPAAGEGIIILREYWKKFASSVPPECEFVFLTYDTALEDKETDDPSAMTAWGVFHKKIQDPYSADEFKHKHLCMLGAWNERVKAVDLINIVDLHREVFKPDLILIEKRASGHQLIQEMQRRRYPVRAWLPKGPPGAKGKVPRAHQASMMFEAGVVHYMDGPMAQAVIDQCSSFPHAQNDDLVDTVTMATDYLRRHYLIDFVTDELDDDEREERAIHENEERWNKGSRRLYGGA